MHCVPGISLLHVQFFLEPVVTLSNSHSNITGWFHLDRNTNYACNILSILDGWAIHEK